MKLFLHTPESEIDLKNIYHKAFSQAVELYVVTAYLTEWDSDLKISADCKSFRIIIGKDFGITKKSACIDLMKWLPAERKCQFMVADGIDGFHPKAIFWKDKDGKMFSLIGSSNLTKAAFEKNYEANIYTELSIENFNNAVNWVKNIEAKSVVVSEDWLDEYRECLTSYKTSKENKFQVKTIELPENPNASGVVKRRREILKNHADMKDGLHELFLKCRDNKISSLDFYKSLPYFWSTNRIQGLGWERRGKNSNFQEISDAYISILDADEHDRDDTVVREIDRLCKSSNPARRSFFSEMLCLAYPDKYPLLNKPVEKYLKEIKFMSPNGASEGAKYLDLAKKLRMSLVQNPKHPAKNLAELDAIIWLEYGD